jgi:hypothetical protein
MASGLDIYIPSFRTIVEVGLSIQYFSASLALIVNGNVVALGVRSPHFL